MHFHVLKIVGRPGVDASVGGTKALVDGTLLSPARPTAPVRVRPHLQRPAVEELQTPVRLARFPREPPAPGGAAACSGGAAAC